MATRSGLEMVAKAEAWKGALAIAPGRAAYIGPAWDTEQHRHHAVQVAVGLQGKIQVELAAAQPTSHPAIAIGAGVEHAIDARGGPVGLYYVEGASTEGRVLLAALAPDGWAAPEGHCAEVLRAAFHDLPATPGDADLRRLGARIGDVLGAGEAHPNDSPCPPVDLAISLLAEMVPGEIRAGEVARQVGISQRQLSAAFARETGLSIRSYVLWLRLQRAVGALADGDNLTEAAHSAGFSDGAHLSRVFRETFGVAPSTGIGRARILKGSAELAGISRALASRLARNGSIS